MDDMLQQIANEIFAEQNREYLQVVTMALLLNEMPNRTFTINQQLMDANEHIFRDYHIHFKRRQNAEVTTYDVILEHNSLHDPSYN